MQIAERMGRLGTETAFDVLARAGALQAAGRSIINLGIGQPDFRTPDHIVEAGRKALADGHHGYTPANGIPALREAVAADIATYRHCEVDPDNVVVVPGGKVTMFFAALMFGEPGAEILYPNPGFPIYESAIKFSGATPVPIPLYEETGFSFDADEVLAKITPRTRLVMLNSPANPTGGVVPRETFDRLAQGLEAHPHVAIMSDEIYSRLLYEGREHVTMLDYPALRDRVIVLDGWSKTYAMTGWRIGYGVWPASLAAHATRLAINCNSCVNAPTQHAALAALTGPQESVEIMRRTFDERPPPHRRRAQPDRGRHLRRFRRRLLRHAQYHWHRARRADDAGRAAGGGRRRHRRRHQLRRLRRGLPPPLLRREHGRDRGVHRPHRGLARGARGRCVRDQGRARRARADDRSHLEPFVIGTAQGRRP